MVHNGKLLGAMLAMNKQHGDFSMIDVKLMRSISDEAGVFLENSFLYEDLEQLLVGMLRALTSAIDAKDPYTCGHSERVAAISAEIARSVGLDDRTVGRVYLSGLLHDVGKIGVPEAVLTKPGRLTKAEFAVMKKHPEIGGRIIGGIKQVEDLLPGVLYHHERMDGRGYPEGLTRKEIPLFGRIIGLADSFDAMTSNRTYRRALPLEVTLAEIRRYAGTQFDPEMVEAFFRLNPASLIRETRQVDPLDPLANVVRQSGQMRGLALAGPARPATEENGR
jgi:HD-GYP domain-containing protein (c-di-GMP phosphodiesterase class II)